MGIIGMGAIGKAVARIATAFGMSIMYYSTSGKNTGAEYDCVSLDTLLKQSDVISIHAPLNEQTEGLIGYDALSLMKKTAILLNLGRGKIVDEEDLARALNDGLLAAAGLDVVACEPIDERNPLFKVKDQSKVFMTPHIGWASVEARERLVEEVIQNIEAVQKGERRNRVV